MTSPLHDGLPLTAAQPTIGMRGAAFWKGVCVGSLQVRAGLPRQTMRFVLRLHPVPDSGLSGAVVDTGLFCCLGCGQFQKAFFKKTKHTKQNRKRKQLIGKTSMQQTRMCNGRYKMTIRGFKWGLL